MSWLERLDNAQRRSHKKAQDPDQQHRFLARRVTAKNDSWLVESVYYDEFNYDTNRWHRVPQPRPCRICGGSESLAVHQEGRNV